ncbi:MAG: hypothetical protein GXY68_03330 [Chloroflexi bacterium]|nr:hypothetical protein [Chloroflexota bacterium]
MRVAVICTCVALLNAPGVQRVEVGPQRAVETQTPKMGVHTRLTDEVEPWKIKRTLELVREMGSPWVVEYFPWAYSEPHPGRYDWAHADLVIEHAMAQGLSLVARIDYVPAWARPPDTSDRYLGSEHYGDYARFAAAFAERYRGRVNHIVVWNEPNLAFEWGYRRVDPEGYVELLAETYRAVKAVAPDTQVLAAGLAPTLAPPGNEWAMDDLEYLRRMYAAGAADWFDAMAIHAYGLTFPASDAPDEGVVNFRRAELVREIMVAHGDDDKPCLITESGWNDHPRWTKGVSPLQRIAYTIEALEIAAEWDWCQALCIWVFRYPWDQRTYQDRFTLVTPEFDPKPIYTELQRYTQGRPFEYLEVRP